MSPWVWVAIAGGSLAMVVLMAVGAVITYYVLDSGSYFEEGDYVVTQWSVEDAVAAPCESMARASGRVAILGSRDAAASSLRDFTDAAGDVVAAIDDAKPDRDSRAWRNDWMLLIQAVDDFAVAIETAEAEFEMPTTDAGRPLSERMYWGSPAGCEVPIVIEALDPLNASKYYSME
jgi:hypothetical protein